MRECEPRKAEGCSRAPGWRDGVWNREAPVVSVAWCVHGWPASPWEGSRGEGKGGRLEARTRLAARVWGGTLACGRAATLLPRHTRRGYIPLPAQKTPRHLSTLAAGIRSPGLASCWQPLGGRMAPFICTAPVHGRCSHQRFRCGCRATCVVGTFTLDLPCARILFC